MQEDDGFTRWMEACAAGELLGIATAVLWWTTVDRFDPVPTGQGAEIAMFVAKSASGLLQGVVLGFLQGWALRRQFPALRPGRWALVTTLVAVALWPKLNSAGGTRRERELVSI